MIFQLIHTSILITLNLYKIVLFLLINRGIIYMVGVDAVYGLIVVFEFSIYRRALEPDSSSYLGFFLGGGGRPFYFLVLFFYK